MHRLNVWHLGTVLAVLLMPPVVPAFAGMVQGGPQINVAPGAPPAPAAPAAYDYMRAGKAMREEAIPPGMGGAPGMPGGAGFEAERIRPVWTMPGYKTVVPEKTEITLLLAVQYGDTDNPNVRKYKATFKGTYVIKGPAKPVPPPKKPPKTPRKVTWQLFFPFPGTADTFPNANVKVDGKDVKDAKYSPAGVQWDSTFLEEQVKTITVEYTAFGADDFAYMLDHTTRTKQFSFTMEITGVEGRPILAPDRCLDPTTKLTPTDDGYVAEWNHTNIITLRDIVVELPRRLMQAEAFARWPNYAFATLLLFAVILVLGSYASKQHIHWAHLPVTLMGLFMFYPLLLALVRHMPVGRAFTVSWLIVSALVLWYLARGAGRRFALTYGGFGLVVLLGLFSIAGLVTKGTTTILTIASLILVAFAMYIAPKLSTPRPPRELPGPALSPPDETPPTGPEGEPISEEWAEEGEPVPAAPAWQAPPAPEPEPEPEPVARKFCAFCGEELGLDYVFCFRCGKGAEITLKCPQCNEPVCSQCGETYTYCPHCGAKLPEALSTAATRPGVESGCA